MLKLMQMELRKNKSRMLKGVLIADLIILAFMLLVVFSGMDDSNEFSTFADVFDGIHVFVKATFIIYASVLICKLVIDEFKSNTITVLFMYPISRIKLMVSKLLIVFLFTLITIYVSDIALSVIVAGVDYYLWDAIQGEITLQMLRSEIPGITADAVCSAGIALIPLFFGMRKKSVPATIISAVLIASLLSSGFGQFRLGNQLAVAAVLSLLGIFIAYLSIRDIEVRDAA